MSGEGWGAIMGVMVAFALVWAFTQWDYQRIADRLPAIGGGA